MYNKDEKVTTSIRVRKDIQGHFKKNGLITSFSDYINSKYSEDFLNYENRIKQLEYHSRQVEKLRQEIRAEKKEIQDYEKLLSNLEIAWMLDSAPGQLERGTFEGVYQYFIRTFKKEKINRRMFRILIKQITGLEI